MIDAYKIGITLALNDEVSTGLAKIQRNLAATDQAVTHAAAHLAHFQMLGRATVEPTAAIHSILDVSYQAPVVGREQTDATPVPADAPAVGTKTSVSHVAESARRLALAPTPMKEVATFKRPDWAAPDWSQFGALATHAMPPYIPETESRAVNSLLSSKLPVAQPVIPSDAKVDKFSAIVRNEMPCVSLKATQSNADDVSSRELAPRDQNQSPKILPKDTDIISPLPRRKHLVEQDAVDVSAAKLVGQMHTPIYKSSVWVPPLTPRREGASVAQPRGSTNYPATNEVDSGRSSHEKREIEQGQLILDGASLGRWIMDRIAHEMTKPPAGMTGFDTRMTPLYGGPAIGV